jgi:hypothetical protein
MMNLRQGYGRILALRPSYASTTRELTPFIGSKMAEIRPIYAFNAAKLWLESQFLRAARQPYHSAEAQPHLGRYALS